MLLKPPLEVAVLRIRLIRVIGVRIIRMWVIGVGNPNPTKTR
jgi:hypothetical protein